MGKSKRKINEGVKIRDFRKMNKITNCQCCGVRLGNMCHHYLCNKCWETKKKKPLEWKHYFKNTHEKYYKNNCEKWPIIGQVEQKHPNESGSMTKMMENK